MNINEVKSNLNKRVKYTSRDNLVDGEFVFNACTIRKGDKGFFYSAEIQQGRNSVLVVRLEDIQTIPGEEQTIC